MNNYSLITYASFNPSHKVGVGAYLIIPESLITISTTLKNMSTLGESIGVKRFVGTSVTKFGLQTVLWALEEFCNGSSFLGSGKLHIYFNVKSVEKLLKRRADLKMSSYTGRGGGRQLKERLLYEKYYEFHNRLKFEVTTVEGDTYDCFHTSGKQIFSLLDKKVSKDLKVWVAQLKAERAEWYVYMIRCRDDALYTGISNDVTRRFEKHREMGKEGAKYLRGRGPIELVFQKKIGNKSSALKMERKVKKLSKSQKEKIIHRGDIDL